MPAPTARGSSPPLGPPQVCGRLDAATAPVGSGIVAKSLAKDKGKAEYKANVAEWQAEVVDLANNPFFGGGADWAEANSRQAAALEALDFGFAVLPLHYAIGGRCSCDEPDSSDEAHSRAKHPFSKLVPSGVHRASRHRNAVALWWQREPLANIGLRCDNVAVLDIDPRHNGDAALRALVARHGPLPPTWVCETGGGGWHLFFELPAGLTTFDAAPGLEVKAGPGSYVVGAGSAHVSGQPYRWAQGCRPDELPLAPMPEWLLSLRPAAKAGGSAKEDWLPLVLAGVTEGKRDKTVTSLIGHLLRHYVDERIAYRLAQCWNATMCRPPLSPEQVRKCFVSIRKKEMARREGVKP